MAASDKSLSFIPYRQDESSEHLRAVNRFSYWFVSLGGGAVLALGIAFWYLDFNLHSFIIVKPNNPLVLGIQRRYEYVSQLGVASGSVFLVSALAFLPLQIVGVFGLFRIYSRKILRRHLGKAFNPRQFLGVAIAISIYILLYGVCLHFDIASFGTESHARDFIFSQPAYAFFFSMCCFVMSVCLMNIVAISIKIMGGGKESV